MDMNAIQQKEKQTPIMLNPRVDAWETPAELTVRVDMPGVDEQSVEVTVNNGTLTIEGCMPEPDVTGDCLACGFRNGRYHRVFELSDHVDVKGIKAQVRQGVLSVILPKREEIKARKIEITAA